VLDADIATTLPPRLAMTILFEAIAVPGGTLLVRPFGACVLVCYSGQQESKIVNIRSQG